MLQNYYFWLIPNNSSDPYCTHVHGDIGEARSWATRLLLCNDFWFYAVKFQSESNEETYIVSKLDLT